MEFDGLLKDNTWGSDSNAFDFITLKVWDKKTKQNKSV